MGTRIRDKASNTDSSIILDSGTSYVKRDDQTVPVYRGITSTNIIGTGGWTWLDRAQRDAAGVWLGTTFNGYMEANVADWGIPVGATAVMFNYRIVSLTSNGSRFIYDWYGNDTQSAAFGATPVTTAEGFHDRWLSLDDEINTSGQVVGWPTSTGRCVVRNSGGTQGPDLYPVGYQMTPGTSATQTNLDAALARITELENNPGGQIIQIITGNESRWQYGGLQLSGWQTGDQVWINHGDTQWKRISFNTNYQLSARLTTFNVSDGGRITSSGSGNVGYVTMSVIHVRGNIGYTEM